MDKRIRDLIPGLDYNDLLKLKKDLKTGGFHLLREVDKEIKKKQSENQKICATCHNEIDLNNPKVFTIIFGPAGFKKKASFCARDCLDYFVKNLK